MQGHIRQRGANSFELRWYAGVDTETGKKRYETTSVKGTKRDAERELRRIITAIDSGTYVAPDNLTVADGFERWLRHKTNRVAHKTYQEYERIVRNYLIPSLGKLKLERIKPTHIEDYLNDSYSKGGRNSQGLSHETLKHHRSVLIQVFDYLLDMELISRNPAKRIEVPGESTFKAQRLPLADVIKVLKAARMWKYYIPTVIAV